MSNNLSLFLEAVDDTKKRIEKEKEKPVSNIYNILRQNNAFFEEIFNSKEGYNSIGDLLSVNRDRLEKTIFKKSGLSFNVVFRMRSTFEKYIHDRGLLFKDEYFDLGIKEEEASVRLCDIKGFPEGVLEVFKNDVCLANILNMKFDKLYDWLGGDELINLKKYLHSIFEEVKDNYSKDEIFIKDMFDDVYIVSILHKNEIFTLSELVSYGKKIFKINGIGPKRQEMILDILSKYNIEFVEVISKDDKKYLEMEKLRFQNNALKLRIREKEERLSEYEQVYLENKYLIEREKELDRIITYKGALEVLKMEEYSK